MIYRIVKEKDLPGSIKGERYIPAGFEENGFVHCASEDSVISVANDYYSNVVERVVLLKIDPLKLTAQTKYESAAPEQGAGTGHVSTSPVFPHVYGPIDLSAVAGIGILFKDQSGYIWPKIFLPLAEYLDGTGPWTVLPDVPH